MRAIPRVVFVVPCYNEAAVLGSTITILLATLSQLSEAELCTVSSSGLILVDDGSHDDTWRLIESGSQADPRVNGLRLSRNKGHQAALVAGLSAALYCSDVAISIDADLQDDVAVCGEMLSLYRQGYDIVYGVRSDRRTDSRSKRFFANLFYSSMLFLGVEIVPGHADFRLIARRPLQELMKYKERSLFMRGVIPLLGFKAASVYYARKSRDAGGSKYPFRKSMSLAVDGILSFSNKPLRLITYLGLLTSFCALMGVVVIVIGHYSGVTVQGWTSMMVVISVIGGIQLLCIGIIGEYLGRIYKEVKRRPRYHVQEGAGRFLEDKF